MEKLVRIFYQIGTVEFFHKQNGRGCMCTSAFHVYVKAGENFRLNGVLHTKDTMSLGSK